ncbi:hypothetical protein EB077_09600 [bacterium]|nr:hypothetical protein [bacterium]
MNKYLFCLWLSLLIVMCVILYNRIEIELDDRQYMTIADVLSNCDTGDLIVFRWYKQDAGHRLFSKYSHVGLVVKVDNHVKVLELHPEGEYKDYPSGVYLHNLRERVTTYPGPCYFAKLQVNKEHLQSVLQNNLHTYRQIKFNDNFRNTFVLNTLKKLIGKSITLDQNTMFCSQFIGKILLDSGFINCNIAELSPESITQLKYNDSNTYLFGKLYSIYF